MLQSFLLSIKKEKLFFSSEKILLTVSGGIDSVVMCELFHQAKYNFGIAHCNFGLREKESDEDEMFAKSLAELRSIFSLILSNTTIVSCTEKPMTVRSAVKKSVSTSTWKK